MVYNDSDLNAPIRSLEEPWEGHTHQEVESFVSSILVDLTGEVTSSLTVAIVGGDTKIFLVDDTSAKFQYTVDYLVDGSPSTSYAVDITIGSTVVQQGYKPGVGAGTPIDSPELINYLKARGNSVNVTIRVYDEATGVSKSRNVTFNKRQAKLTSNLDLGSVWTTANPIRVPFGVNIDYGSYELPTGVGRGSVVSRFTDSTGATQDVITSIGAGNTVNVVVPDTLANGSCEVESHIVLNDPQLTQGNTVYSSLIIVHDGTDGINPPESGTIYLSADVVGNVSMNNYADIQYNMYVVGGSSTLKRPVILQKSMGSSAYVTQAIKNAGNNVLQHWNYLVTDAITPIRIVVPNVDENGNIIYGSGNQPSIAAYAVFDIVASPSNVGWESATDGLVFSLSAQNKSNDDYDLGTWANGNYEMAFEDMQWDGAGSGWSTARYEDNDGNVYTSNALKLVGKSRAYIKEAYFEALERKLRDFAPMYSEEPYSSDERLGGGILRTGLTLKMTFMINNISNPDLKVIDCWDGNVGFYVTGNGIYINIGNELVNPPSKNPAMAQTNTRKFQEGTKMDLTIVVYPYYDSAGTATAREIFYYINGEVAGYTRLNASTTTLSQLAPTRITFGGDGAVLNIFDIKYYNRPLSSLEVFETYTMNLDSSSQINGIFEKNNYYTEISRDAVIQLSNAIAYGKYLASKGRTNFAVWVSTNLCNAEDGVPIAAGKTSTKDFTTRGEKFYYFRFTQDADGRGIIDRNLSFFLDSDLVSIDGTPHSALRFRRQGTSTVDAIKGNIRIDVQKDDGVRLHRFISEALGFDTEPEEVLKKKAKVWQIPDDHAIACYLLTLKKNPNDSTQARNLPTAKWYEDCARYLATRNFESYGKCLTKPQRVELESIQEVHPELSLSDAVNMVKTRQCVDGIPSVGFRIDYAYASDPNTMFNPLNDEVTSFGGQFDLITDKTNMDVFGFGLRNTQDAEGNIIQTKLKSNDHDFSLEWRSNQSDACCFQTNNLSGVGTSINISDGSGGTTKFGNGYFEYRYPTKDPLNEDDDCYVVPEIDLATYQSIEPRREVSVGMGYEDPIQGLFDLVSTCSPLKSDPRYSSDLLGFYYWHGQKIMDNRGLPRRRKDGSVYAWVQDNAANRRLIFREEFGYYVVVPQFLLNGLILDAGLMCDQDVKNQFFTYFTGEDDEGVITYNDEEHTYSNKLLRLLGYDFDSSWGMDNDNNLRFTYTVRYEDALYDGEGSKSKQSMLWKLVFDCFKPELVAMASTLHNGGLLNSAGIVRYMFDNEVSMFNSFIYNANSKYSYMDDVPSNWPKVHGSAEEHNRWFVEGRLYFKGGEYFSDASDLASDATTFFPQYVGESEAFYTNPFFQKRAEIGPNNLYLQLDVTGYERTYATLRYGRAYENIVQIDTDIVYDPSTGLPTGQINYSTGHLGFREMPNLGSSDSRLYIVGCKHLKTIEGLPYWFISQVDGGWKNLVNMENLQIGSTDSMVVDGETIYYENPYLTWAGLSFEGVSFGSCKNLNLAGLSGVTGAITLEAFPVLEYFEGIRMNNVTSIAMPAGSSLISAHYPKNMTSWSINNKPRLTDITFEAYDKITTISVTSSSQEAADKAIELLNNLMN